MFTFLKYFFCSLGVIFFCILCGLGYLWVVDPFGLRPIIVEVVSEGKLSNVQDALQQGGVTLDRNPALSATQEAALRTIGIDPATVPSTVTPDMRECFENILGVTRVQEIQKGAQPSALEVLQTKDCYQ